MDEKELQEIMQQLAQAGINAQLCDTPVPVSSNPVRCGIPTEVGDIDMNDYVLLPKRLLGSYPCFILPVVGDSMRDCGYEDGDSLRVRVGCEARDGDNVLACVDGGCTVKTLFTDEDGVKWLVPQNEEYDAIMLTEEMDVRIYGVVVEVVKTSTRSSSRQLLQSIRRTKQKKRVAQKLSTAAMDAKLREIGELVLHARQWYAVYRSMLDKELVVEGDFVGFCERVCSLLPEHKHLPTPRELARMAVQSFAKPVSMWVSADAPVQGSRFYDYLRIAKQTGAILSRKPEEQQN